MGMACGVGGHNWLPSNTGRQAGVLRSRRSEIQELAVDGKGSTDMGVRNLILEQIDFIF